jgi:hypothetical protein
MALFVGHAEGICVLQPSIYDIFNLKDKCPTCVEVKTLHATQELFDDLCHQYN